jgi:hypothetical protein
MTGSFLSTLLANTIYAFAFSYYFYITFLGYEGMFGLIEREREREREFVCARASVFDDVRTRPVFAMTDWVLLCCSRCTALPFLENTLYFIYPVGLVFALYVVSLPLNFNICNFVMGFYFH